VESLTATSKHNQRSKQCVSLQYRSQLNTTTTTMTTKTDMA